MAIPTTRIVLLGSGFGAFSFIKKVNTEFFNVIAVSPRNHFIFTPLLPSTTVGTIEFRSIIEPIRGSRKNLTYYEAYATGLDTDRNIVHCRAAQDGEAFSLTYDALVIAVGARTNTFDIPGVREHALFLKEVADARAIRQRIGECFERASQPTCTLEDRHRLLHFVVVGGGPTGVEFAAELHDFLEEDLNRLYPHIAGDVRITLLEAGSGILNSFDASLREYTATFFRRQKIDVRTDSHVARIDDSAIHMESGEQIPYGMIVWTTGLAPTEFVTALPLAKDQAGRLLTDEYCVVRGTPNVHALGDCSNINEHNYPATSQVAQQQGYYLAAALHDRYRSKRVRPFTYRHYGMLAYIGSNRALADLARVKGKGFTTWLFWRSAYLTKLVSWKNKILVMFDWTKTIIFGRDISRF